MTMLTTSKEIWIVVDEPNEENYRLVRAFMSFEEASNHARELTKHWHECVRQCRTREGRLDFSKRDAIQLMIQWDPGAGTIYDMAPIYFVQRCQLQAEEKP